MWAPSPGRARGAEALREDAAALVDRVGNPHFESIRRRQGLAEALLASGDPAGARAMFESVLAEAGEQAPANIHVTTSLGLSRVADFEENYTAALEHAQAALAILEFHGSDSPLLATPLTNIGVALTKLGRYQEAREALERAVQLRRAVLEAESSPGNRRRLGEDLINLAILESNAGDAEAAADAYREALALLPADDYANRSLVLLNLGVDHQVAGRREQALDSYQESLRLAERVLPLDSKQVVGARLGVGSMLVDLGRPAEARAFLERCRSDWPKPLLGSFDEAELDFALARTQVALDGWSTQSESLANHAAALYRRLGDAGTAEAIEAWISVNGK